MSETLNLKKAERTAVLILSDLKGYRQAQKLNQRDFWGRYGATQSGGSRYEDGRRVPAAMVILMVLHDLGHIPTETLELMSQVSRPTASD